MVSAGCLIHWPFRKVCVILSSVTLYTEAYGWEGKEEIMITLGDLC